MKVSTERCTPCTGGMRCRLDSSRRFGLYRGISLEFEIVRKDCNFCELLEASRSATQFWGELSTHHRPYSFGLYWLICTLISSGNIYVLRQFRISLRLVCIVLRWCISYHNALRSDGWGTIVVYMSTVDVNFGNKTLECEHHKECSVHDELCTLHGEMCALDVGT